MIGVTYRLHKRGDILEKGISERIAYFPSLKAAMILIPRWNNQHWAIEIRSVYDANVDPSEWHADCRAFAHLIRGC